VLTAKWVPATTAANSARCDLVPPFNPVMRSEMIHSNQRSPHGVAYGQAPER
jgi:hypothetical protein